MILHAIFDFSLQQKLDLHASLRSFDARSAERLYVRVDKGKSYALFGDFVTGDGFTQMIGQGAVASLKQRSLGQYNRTGTGARVHHEDGRMVANLFGTRDTLRQWIDRTRGVLVTDRGSQFGFWAMDRRQICWAHLIRKFAAFSELRGRPGAIGADLLLWSQVLLHAWHRVRDGTGTRADLKAVVLNLRAQIELLLDEGAALPVKGFQGACRNILDHRAALWRFVYEAGVDPTNNHAERELRGLVCWRRSTGGSRSDRGDLFAANLKSVIHTEPHEPQAAPARPHVSPCCASCCATRPQDSVPARPRPTRAPCRPPRRGRPPRTSRPRRSSPRGRAG
jgi:hypothetical protein